MSTKMNKMDYIFKFTLNNETLDITEVCRTKLYFNDLLIIPPYNILVKHILRKENVNPDDILLNPDEKKTITIYEKTRILYTSELTTYVCLDFEYSTMYYGYLPEYIIIKINNHVLEYPEHKLWFIQNQLRLSVKHFHEEYPEQIFITKYLTGNEKVLELGANVGRTSLIIGHILNKCNNSNFVALEPAKETYDKLVIHKNMNNLNFYAENFALSKRKLLQRNWDTIISDIPIQDWDNVNTINFNELYDKYRIKFDTLVIDCEGAFFQILLDMPDLLLNIKLVIMENDYSELWKKQCVDHILKVNGFKRIDSMPLGYNIEWVVCKDNFYEVWRK